MFKTMTKAKLQSIGIKLVVGGLGALAITLVGLIAVLISLLFVLEGPPETFVRTARIGLLIVMPFGLVGFVAAFSGGAMLVVGEFKDDNNKY